MSVIVLLWFLSGVFSGLLESLHYHYARFKRIYKYRVDIITDGNGLPHSISSIGKPRFLFSLTLLRSLTDGSHLVQALSALCTAIGWGLSVLYLHQSELVNYDFLLIFLLLIIHYISKGIGFFFTYTLI